MCNVCIATGRMTSAEWDQIQAAERDQNLAALLDITDWIKAHEMERRANIPDAVQLSPEDKQEHETLDSVLVTLIGMARGYAHLPLRKAHEALARDILSMGNRQLAHGLAAVVTRIYRDAQ